MSQDYLEPVDDGLPMRESQDYAKDKLRLLEAYIARFIVSMRQKQWRAINFIDLQAGPGKNKFDPSGEVGLGSPLIALTAKADFDKYWLVEMGEEEFGALSKRISASSRVNKVQLLHGDCNVVIDEIKRQIDIVDKKFIEGKWSSLNLAFLDPEGLELKWSSVEKLGQIRHMDLIINFSTSGITRNVKQLIERGQTETLDAFFGTSEWKQVYEKVADKDNTNIRRTMIDYYKARLAQLGYVNNLEHESQEQVFKNSKNVQIYTLVSSSKHKLGVKFWNDAIQAIKPRLI